MVPELPSQLYDLIFFHASAMCIQRSVRRMQMRHARATGWLELRRDLAAVLDHEDWIVLLKTMWIRKEWMQERESWIYMLKHESGNLKKILDECRERQALPRERQALVVAGA